MAIGLSQCFVAVDDHDKALAFHRDALGRELRNGVACEGMRAHPRRGGDVLQEPADQPYGVACPR
ncbi:hypothetical protein ACFYXV_26745 [Streptomyces sp. NPDC002181]|uniref:hypothetical protein n=1 Tax=unclassified Streptomyces TaxID=2593676 RepID=UPI003655C769